MISFQEKISKALRDIILEEYGLNLDYSLWDVPQRQGFGDLSSMVALKLASRLKKDSLDIALSLKNLLEKKLIKSVDKIEIIKPGFINVFIAKDTLIKALNEVIKSKGRFFSQRQGKRILIEFLSANPTGPLSIAHGRQAIVGDAMANILEFCGNKVEREYYLNDAGKQIELLVASVDAKIKEVQGKDCIFPEGGYKGAYIEDTVQAILAAGGKRKKWTKDDLEKGVIKEHISLIKKDLKALGIKFDNWFSQKNLLAKKKVEKAIKALKKKGLIYEKEGALWFPSTKFGDDKDRVIEKVDKELTYFASDIAYHKDKVERKFDELINLWGPDHHGYIKRVKTSIQALGYKENILKIIIVQLVTLKTKERMSKRAGTLILLSDLIKDVGKDATRFYYLTRKNSSHLEFDIDLAKEASFDNPLYYIQYVCARIESIFRKAKVSSFNNKYTELLDDPEELNLLRSLLQFSYCLQKTRQTLEPVFIIEFLKNLASNFHKFYEKVRVIDNDKNLTKARLNLLQAVRIVFHTGLGLLGIVPAKKM